MGRKIIEQYSLIALGVIIFNFTYVMVTVPFGIINGGVTSMSMILSRLPLAEALPVNAWVSIVTCTLAMLCCIFLGRKIFIASIYSCIVGIASFNLFTYIAPAFLHEQVDDFAQLGSNSILNAGLGIELILAAIVVGIGYFLCLDNDSTAVSMDTIALIIHKRNDRIPVAYAMYAINISVLLLGMFTYGIKCVIMGIAFAGMQALTLNTCMKLFGKEGKSKKHKKT